MKKFNIKSPINLKINRSSVNPKDTVKNTFKSIKTIFVSELEDTMPFLSIVTTDVNDIISSSMSKVKGTNAKSINKGIASEINSSIKTLFTNLKKDLTTGNWISEDDALDELGFGDFDTFSEGGEEGTYSSDDVSHGETFIAEANARAVKMSSDNISNSVKSAALAQIESSKEIATRTTKIGVGAMASGFNAVNGTLINLLDFSTNSAKEHFDNSANYYRTMMENSATIVNLLSEIKESTVSNNQEDSSIEKSLFRKIFGDGNDFNIRELSKALFGKLGEDATDLAKPFFDELKSNIANPMQAITSAFVKKYSVRTKDILSNLDTDISDLFTNVVNKLFKSDLTSLITYQSLGTTKKIESKDYFKGDMRWNGYAQKSIMDVIPGYLSRIESYITKGPQIIFDYESGKWITKSNIKKQLDSKYEAKGASATYDLMQALSEIVDMKKFTKSEKESFREAVPEFQRMIMEAAMKGEDVFSLISKNKLLTKSEIFNASLQTLFKDNGMYKIDPKIKNRLNANLIRMSQDLSDEFKELAKKNVSVFQLEDMESEITDILKLNRLENHISPGYGNPQNVGSNGQGRNKKNKVFNNKAFKDIYENEKSNYNSENESLIVNTLNRHNNIKKHYKYQDLVSEKHGYITNYSDFLKVYRDNSVEKMLVLKHDKDFWFKLYRDFKDDKIRPREFDRLWENKNFRVSFAVDILLLLSDKRLMSKKISPDDANDVLAQLIQSFDNVTGYRDRTDEEILSEGSRYVSDENSSLYGMDVNEFKKAKLKNKKDLTTLRESQLEDYIKDATEFSPASSDDGSVGVLKSLDSILSIPDKMIYGIFKKVDKYVFNAVFDDGRFFDDSNYKGILPTIKETAISEMKKFGEDLTKEVIDPLSNAAKDTETSSLFSRIKDKLGIDDTLDNFQERIDRYFNGERDDNGNLVQVGLKHEIIDDIKNHSRSIYGLGAETVKDLFSLGKKFDGAYAEGGLIGSGLDKPSYDETENTEYEVEKDAFTEYISKALWDKVPSFAEGGTVEENTTNSNNNAENLRVVSGSKGGVVITAQSGESVLTKDQTEALIRRIKIHIKNGTASPEDIDLAKKLGISYKISTAKDFVISNINKFKEKNKSEDDEEETGAKKIINDVTDTFKTTFNKTVESLFNPKTKETEEKIAKSKEMLKLFGKEGAKNISSLLSGGIIGAGASLLLPGLNPFIGVTLGAGLALASKSSRVQKSLFGDDEESGLISKGVGDYIKEKLPKTAMGGVLGTVGSTFLLGNPIPGLLLGSSLAHAVQSDEFRMKMFGTLDPEKILKNKERMKKIIPSALIGAGLTAFTGPFGLVGNILMGGAIGTGMGVLNATGKLEKAFFGEKAEDGKYYGGLLPTFRETVLEPMGDKLSKLMQDTRNWFKDAIYDNIKKGLSPLSRGIKSLFRRGFNTVKGLGRRAATIGGNTVIGRGLKRGLHKTTKFAANVASIPLYALGGVTGLGAKMIGGIGEKVDKRLLKTAAGSGEFTAAERQALSEKYGVDDYLSMYTNILNDRSVEDKMAFRDSLRYIQNITDSTESDIAKKRILKDRSKKYRSLALEISKNGGWKDEKAYHKLLKQGRLEDAIELLRNDNMLSPEMRDTLLNDAESVLEEYNKINHTVDYDEAYNNLLDSGFTERLINKFIKKDEDGNVKLVKGSKLAQGLSLVNRDIDKGHYMSKNIYDATMRERGKMGSYNRLKSVDDIIEKLISENRISDLNSFKTAIMGMHLSGNDIKSLVDEGLNENQIKGYKNYEYLKSLGISDELLDTFTEKDKIAISKSIKAGIHGIDKDTDPGLSNEFKFEEIVEESNAPVVNELSNIYSNLEKYMPILAAATGMADSEDVKDDANPNSDLVENAKDTKSLREEYMDKMKSEIEENLKSSEDDSSNKKVSFTDDGKKKIEDRNGNVKFDMSDKQTRAIINKENEETELRHGFYNSFKSLFSSFSGDKKSESDEDGEPKERRSLFGKLGTIGKILSPLSLFFLPNLLNKLTGDSEGLIKDFFGNMKDGIMSAIKSAFGMDTGNEDGSTSSDEEDEQAKKDRTPIQNIINATFGEATGRSGYMGETDTLQDAKTELGSRTARKLLIGGEKMVRKGLEKTSIFDKFKNKMKTKVDGSSATNSKITKDFIDNASFNSKYSADVSKFSEMVDNMYQSLIKLPNFGEVFSNSKFIKTLTSFCSDKAILSKIDFNKISKAIGDAISTIINKAAYAIDDLVKAGPAAISKFVAKTAGKGFKSTAKLIPFIGVAFIVADVVSGMINYRDLLGISRNADLSIMQQIMYRILGGVGNTILNLPFIWVFSLLTSEETLMDIILKIGDDILPGSSKLTQLRKSTESEIEQVNQILEAEGKDEISSVKQLNEYYRRNKINSQQDLNNALLNIGNNSTNGLQPAISKVSGSIAGSISGITNSMLSKARMINIPTNSQQFGIGGEDINKNDVDFVGKYVKQYESGKAGSRTISSGKGDYGGVSYGSFQFASFSQKDGAIGGSAKTFWENNYANKHKGLELVNNDTFKQAWLSEVDKDPNGFFRNEHDHIMNGYYKQLLKRYPDITKYIKSRAMQESIMSTTVQYGVGGAANIYKNVLSKYDPETTSQSDLIAAIQKYKADNVSQHFRRSSKNVQNSLKKNRIPQERDMLMTLTSMPVIDTSRITGDITTYDPSATTTGHLDPNSIDGEGSDVKPTKGFMGLLSNLSDAINMMTNPFTSLLTGSSSESNESSESGETSSYNETGSSSVMNGITSSDDHFGFKVTSKFGEDRGGKAHSGIDYGMPEGTKVITPVGGKVEINKTNPNGYGEYVGIRDSNKMLHIFGHLKDRRVVKLGDTVSPGDVVGISGNTGASTGPHLHYEVTNTLGTGRKAIDPNLYLAEQAKLSKNQSNVDSFDASKVQQQSQSSQPVGTGGKAMDASSLINSGSNVSELLNKIISLLTISNANTSLIQTVVNIISSINNGDLKANSEKGENIVNSAKDIMKSMSSESISSKTSDIFSMLQQLASV